MTQGDAMDLDLGALEDPSLFDIEAPPPVSLGDKFLVPPMSVLDRRSGLWQDRKRQWLRLGIRSELGREAQLIFSGGPAASAVTQMHVDYSGGTSIFDPVAAELAYRWFTPTGARVLDPFAGGAVRGIVASTLGRDYLGIELRSEQVAANQAQAHLGSDIVPQWVEGDARDAETITAGADFDLVFSCPPYADLEVYSDDPRDLSTMPYPVFLREYRRSIEAATTVLRRHRFAVWVISDVRSRGQHYHGLVRDTITAFEDAGLHLYNDCVMIDNVGTAALRAERPFMASRKITRTHQHLLVFVKGDPRAAAAYARGDT